MSGGFSKFIYDKTEAIHRRLEGGARGMDENGRDVPIGTFGSYLHGMNEDRFNAVSYKFSQTPMGSTMLGYLQEQHVQASVDHRREDGAIYRPVDKSILITPYSNNDRMIGFLAHEARHAHQHEKLKKMMGAGNMPPEAEIVINRFIEADAYMFQRKFCEDYAERTGDKGPLREVMIAQETAFPGINTKLSWANTDADRFRIWNDALIDTHYDGETMDFVEKKNLDRSQDPSLRKNMISPEATDKLIVAAARQIDTDWPLERSGAKPNHYLSSLSDRDLVSPEMKKMPSFGNVENLKTDYAGTYASKHAGISMRSSAPPPSAPAPAAQK